MFSTLRTRFGIPGVISVIALVFAMFGGAYAASSDNGGKATASKAKKGPRGPKGPKGDSGPAGPQGPAGPAGAKGDTGAAGSNGQNGADGQSVTGAPIAAGSACGTGVTGVKYTLGATSTNVCNGKEGPKGDPWTAGGFLPSGETLTGTWAVGPGGLASSEGSVAQQFVPISFPLPLEGPSQLTVVMLYRNELFSEHPFFSPEEVEDILEEGGENGCPGFEGSVPIADPGRLCVYFSSGGFLEPTGTPLTPTIRAADDTPQVFTGGSFVPGPNGAGKEAGVNQVGTTLEMKCLISICNGLGTWAVTAE